jgi:hypothetical protein
MENKSMDYAQSTPATWRLQQWKGTKNLTKIREEEGVSVASLEPSGELFHEGGKEQLLEVRKGAEEDWNWGA